MLLYAAFSIADFCSSATSNSLRSHSAHWSSSSSSANHAPSFLKALPSGGKSRSLTDASSEPAAIGACSMFNPFRAASPLSYGEVLNISAMRSKANAISSRRSLDFGSQKVTALRSSSCGEECSIGEECSTNCAAW